MLLASSDYSLTFAGLLYLLKAVMVAMLVKLLDQLASGCSPTCVTVQGVKTLEKACSLRDKEHAVIAESGDACQAA